MAKNKKDKVSPVLLGAMSKEQLEAWINANRSRKFTDRKKQASRVACRKYSDA